MKVWTCNKFECHWGEPSAAVVVAPDRERAAELLNADLVRMQMEPTAKPCDMEQVDTQQEYAKTL